MAVDAMPIANREQPVVLKIRKVLDAETDILVLLLRFVRNITFFGSVSEVVDWVLKANVCVS